MHRSLKQIGMSVLGVGMLAFMAAGCSTRPASADSVDDLKGRVAPEFTLRTVDDKSVSLADQKGKVVLLDFWATWCPPCRESLPHLQKMADDADKTSRGLVVYAVDAREATGTVLNFIQKNGYTFTVPLDANGEVMSKYNIDATPTTVIIGRDGKVRSVFIGYDPDSGSKEIDKAVEEALNQK